MNSHKLLNFIFIIPLTLIISICLIKPNHTSACSDKDFICKLLQQKLKDKLKKDSKFKIIKPNSIVKENVSSIASLLVDPKENFKNMVKIEDKHIQYVKSERGDAKLMSCHLHPFLEAVHWAYSRHLALTISPDIIWYVISSGIASHINLNAESLRKQFVNHEGKKKIEIRRDDFVFNSKTNPWHEVLGNFTIQIRNNTNNNVADLFVANFTTTSQESRVVSQIVLMDSMQNYFEYVVSTTCGIPEIKLLGNKKDWENVKKKANSFPKMIPELKKWLKALNEILNHFIKAYDGSVDNKFWNSIYKRVDLGSGDAFISGWILSFFPYLKDNKKNKFVWGRSWKDLIKNEEDRITTDDFSYHMNQVPFTWIYYGQEIKMLFLGGLVGISHEKDNSLMPVFGYAVTEDKIINEKDFREKGFLEILQEQFSNSTSSYITI